MIERVKYRRPRRFNAVSLVFVAAIGLVGYIGYVLWPVVSLRLAVKEEIRSMLPELWRANLRGGSSRQEEARMRRELLRRLTDVGVRGQPELIIERSKQLVSIEVRFIAVAEFPGINQFIEFEFSPRSETDAARVEW